MTTMQTCKELFVNLLKHYRDVEEWPDKKIITANIFEIDCCDHLTEVAIGEDYIAALLHIKGEIDLFSASFTKEAQMTYYRTIQSSFFAQLDYDSSIQKPYWDEDALFQVPYFNEDGQFRFLALTPEEHTKYFIPCLIETWLSLEDYPSKTS